MVEGGKLERDADQIAFSNLREKEAGKLNPKVYGTVVKKGDPEHANAVIGDTVGDPLKDTSGPALNIVMKLCAIMSLVFGSVIADYSNSQGGPKWLSVA